MLFSRGVMDASGAGGLSPSTRFSCRLVVSAYSQHLYRVITGLVLLDRARVVDLSLRYDASARNGMPTSHIAELHVAGGPVVAYDVLDGYNFVDRPRLDEYLGRVDVYFKRAFDPEEHGGLEHAARIRPLGLSYPVTIAHPFFLRIALGMLRDPRRMAGVVRYMRLLDVRRMEAVPRRVADARVIYQTRAWDPDEVETDGEGEERERMNELRVACIRLLRNELGSRFRGGLMHTPYARRRYPDCLLPDPRDASKGRYLRLMREADVGVAVTGLHGSNGAMLGEYVAASKAVVAQRPRYEAPGFGEGRNYLGFSTADECVDRVTGLVGDQERRYRMKVDNYLYYHEFLRPDRQVQRTLLEALADAR